jgi:hypothetical protein
VIRIFFPESFIVEQDRRRLVAQARDSGSDETRSWARYECVAEGGARVEHATPAAGALDQTAAAQHGEVVGDIPGRAREDGREPGGVRGLVERAQDVASRTAITRGQTNADGTRSSPAPPSRSGNSSVPPPLTDCRRSLAGASRAVRRRTQLLDPILDRAPKSRDEAWQVWIRRHDEYESK